MPLPYPTPPEASRMEVQIGRKRRCVDVMSDAGRGLQHRAATHQPIIRKSRETGERELILARWAWCRCSRRI